MVMVRTSPSPPLRAPVKKLLDLVDQGVGVAYEEQAVVAEEHHELGIGDVLGQVPTCTPDG
jgi:hypothetical protein